MTEITYYRLAPPTYPYPYPHDRQIYFYNTAAGPLRVRIADILKKIH